MDIAARYRFQLYIADQALNSVQAVANLHALCETYLTDRYEIDIVDVLQQPERAFAEKVFMTPTLLKLEPGPPLRIVGNLSCTDVVLHSLGLEPVLP
jgi:circadian clock protein KaiB